jgi:hypothetical protein
MAPEVRLEIISITGERVYEETLPAGMGSISKQLEPELAPGMYFLRAWAGKQTLTGRFIKQ